MLKEVIKEAIDERGTVVFPDVIDILFKEAERRGYNFLADELENTKAQIEALADDAEEISKVKGQEE